MTTKSASSASRRALLAGGTAAATAPLWGHIALAQGTRKFRFMTPFGYSLAFAPVLYGKVGGFFEKEGLDADIVGGKGAALSAQMTIAGQMEAARTGAGNFMVARVNNGAPLISIATIAQVSPFYVLSPKAKPLTDPKTFSGRKIGMASLGGSMEETLNLTMRRAAVDPASVEKVKVADSPASYALVEAGRIDGFMGNISTMEKAVAAFPGASAVRMDDGVPGQVYVATPGQIEKNEALYVSFLRAVHRSVSALLDTKDTEPIIRELGKTFQITGLDDMAVARRDLAKNAEAWIAKGRNNLLRNVPDHWTQAVRLMHEAQMLKSAPDATTLYTNALLDKAIK